MGVVVRRYIDFLMSLILYLFFFAAASLLFVHLKKLVLFFYTLHSLQFIGSVYNCAVT